MKPIDLYDVVDVARILVALFVLGFALAVLWGRL